MYWLKKRLRAKFWAYLEAVIYTLITLFLCLHFKPNDPFLLHSAFPWLWLVPAFVALRVGLGPGLVAFLVVLIGFVGVESLRGLESQFHRLYLLGGLILIMICGEFSSAWNNRRRQLELSDEYTRQQLNLMSESYYLLRHSHEHLEKQLIMRPYTLRSAISDLRELIAHTNGSLNIEHAKRLLGLLTHYCNIEKCALYKWQQHKPETQPLATHNSDGELDLTDPLIQATIKNEKAMYHTQLEDDDLSSVRYLITLPVKTSDDVLFGLCVVESMPFFAYQPENIEFMQVLINYYANSLMLYRQALPLLEKYPYCPPAFALELHRMRAMSKQSDISSYLTGILVENIPEQNDILEQLQFSHRGLDVQWMLENEKHKILFIIMPFCHRDDVTGYRKRIEVWLQNQHDLSFSGKNVRFFTEQFSASVAPDVVLDQVLRGLIC